MHTPRVPAKPMLAPSLVVPPDEGPGLDLHEAPLDPVLIEKSHPSRPAPVAYPFRKPDPLELPVLVVNRFFQPVQITTARRAFLLLFGGSALAIDEAGDLHDFSGW